MILDIVPSNDNKHKYTAYILNEYGKIKQIKFGAIDYEHYYDLLKHYKKLNHLNIDRRNNYYARHSINYPKYSADWFSKKVLWPLKIIDKPKKSIIDYLNKETET
jgi:hypothetical protein